MEGMRGEVVLQDKELDDPYVRNAFLPNTLSHQFVQISGRGGFIFTDFYKEVSFSLQLRTGLSKIICCLIFSHGYDIWQVWPVWCDLHSLRGKAYHSKFAFRTEITTVRSVSDDNRYSTRFCSVSLLVSSHGHDSGHVLPVCIALSPLPISMHSAGGLPSGAESTDVGNVSDDSCARLPSAYAPQPSVLKVYRAHSKSD